MYIVHTVDKPYKRHTFLVERTNFKVQPYIYLTLSPIRFFALILFCIKWMHLFYLTLLFSYLKQFYHASVIFATLFTLYNNLLWFAHILQQSTMLCPPFTTIYHAPPFTSIYHALSTFYNNLPCIVHLLQQIYHALSTFYNNLPCFAHLLQQSTTLCPPFATIYHALPTFYSNLPRFAHLLQQSVMLCQ